jgi:hypothetical protein
MKLNTTVHIYLTQYSWEEKGSYQAFTFKLDNDTDRVYVCSQEIELDLPDDFDPRPSQIATLEDKKTMLMADFHKSVTEINDKISKLQALEYTA